MKNRSNWWAALLSVGLMIAIGLPVLSSKKHTGSEATAADPEPSRERVQRQAMRASTWRFVYCLEAGTAGEELISLLHQIAAAQPMGKRIEVVDCQGLPVDTLGGGPLTMFGNRLPDRPEDFVLKPSRDGWEFDGRLAIGRDDILFLPAYRNPWGSQPTVAGFYLSGDLPGLVAALRHEYETEWTRMFWTSWAYELHQADGDRVYGSYDVSSWEFDETEEVRMESPDVPVYQQDGLVVYSYDGTVTTEELERSVAGIRTVRSLLDSLTGTPMDWYPEVRLYPSLERIGLRQGSMAPVQYDAGAGLLHLVPCFLNDTSILRSFAIWRPFVEQLAEDTLTGSRLDYVIATLQNNVDTEAFPVFRNATVAAQRVLATGVLRGSADFAVEDGSSFIQEASARITTMGAYLSTPEAVKKEIAFYAKAPPKATAFGRHHQADDKLGKVEKRTMPGRPLAGMTFAHQGYRVHNGYGGEKIKPSIDSLVNLHVNALAIVPYTFMRNPTTPAPLPIPERAGSENDWATICSIREAKRRGMFVLLKPQIWIGGGHWPGDVNFATEAEWDSFFEHYTYWIMHYALLAEQEQVGALCLGTELVQTTLKHPDRWRELIRKVRMVYGGQLTYAANWGEEFEGFTFWDALDAIGLNSYYPLSEKEDPTDGELLAGAQRWMQMAAGVSRKADRPLWLTETGFRSTDRAWQNPHADAGERLANDRAQERCFDALLTAAAETPELRGIFIWKWPSFLGKQDQRNPGTGFTPGGKPAALTLGKYYQNWVE